MKRLLFVLAFALVSMTASAQAVIAPTTAIFAHPDADFAITSTYHVDFFTCSSVTTTGVCVGQATTPFQSGMDIPKGQVTGTAAARAIDMRAAPASGLLASVPNGVGIVATVIAVADTSQPGVVGNSPPSLTSNAFFARPRTPAAPGAPVVR